MLKRWLLAMSAMAMLSGCDESTGPHDVIPPAAPRGLQSVTGDGEARLSWLANTESDVAGYRVYMSPCASGPDCPYDRIGTTGGTMFVAPLANGATRFFAVAAYDRAGNESALSKEDVYDTPRPAGYGLALNDYQVAPATAGWDFSAETVVPYDSPNVDIYFGYAGGVATMFTYFTDVDLQDAGFTNSLDDVDRAPGDIGWATNGQVELIPGHSYIVQMSSGVPSLAHNYAKFRVLNVSSSPARVVIDWAYQIDPDNTQLRSRPAKREGARTPRSPIAWSR
jgi:hypothetical protein